VIISICFELEFFMIAGAAVAQNWHCANGSMCQVLYIVVQTPPIGSCKRGCRR